MFWLQEIPASSISTCVRFGPIIVVFLTSITYTDTVTEAVQTSCKAVILPLEAANGSSGSLTDIHHVVVHAVHSERLCEEVGVVLPLRQVAVVLEQVANELQDNEHIPLPRND